MKHIFNIRILFVDSMLLFDYSDFIVSFGVLSSLAFYRATIEIRLNTVQFTSFFLPCFFFSQFQRNFTAVFVGNKNLLAIRFTFKNFSVI